MIDRIPSWADYATHDKSRFPELWDGCVLAVCAALGASGNKAYDFSGFGNHLSLAGDAVPETLWSVNRGITAFRFFTGGRTNRLESSLPLGVDIRTSGQPFTVCAWAEVVSYSTGGHFPILTVGTEDYNAFTFGAWRNRLCILQGSPSWTFLPADYGSLPEVPLNTPIHIVYAFNSGNTALYSNGILVESFSAPQPGTNNLTVMVGSHYKINTAYMCDGYIDDVRVYNRALSHSEAALLAVSRGISYVPKNRHLASVRRFNPALVRNANSLIPGSIPC